MKPRRTAALAACLLFWLHVEKSSVENLAETTTEAKKRQHQHQPPRRRPGRTAAAGGSKNRTWSASRNDSNAALLAQQPGRGDEGRYLVFNVTNPKHERDLRDVVVRRRNRRNSGGGGSGRREEVAEVEESPLAHCPVTRQMRIDTAGSHNASTANRWIVETYDAAGNAKFVGGDEFYVEYYEGLGGPPPRGTAPPTAVAKVADNRDGTHVLDFVETAALMGEEGRGSLGSQDPTSDVRTAASSGTLVVHFQYTCGIGQMPIPSKQKWRNSGAILTSNKVDVVNRPPIRPFRVPNDVDDGSKSGIDLGQYDTVYYVGDSTMRDFWQFAGILHTREPYLSYQKPYRNTRMIRKLISVIFELLSDCGERYERNKTTAALVLGSGIWDLLTDFDNANQGGDFEGHLATCQKVIEAVRKHYPDVTIFWKSMTAMHPHRLNKASCFGGKGCSKRTKYMSSSRAEALYEKQKHLVQEGLNVQLLDVYEASFLAAHYTKKEDGRHFLDSFNALTKGWFFRRSTNEKRLMTIVPEIENQCLHKLQEKTGRKKQKKEG